MGWDEALAVTDAVTASVFDTVTLTVKPRKGGIGVNSRPIEDPARAPFDFLASLDLSPPGQGSDALIGDPGPGRSGATRFEAVVTALDTGWPYLPARRDHMLAGDILYEIADVTRDGTSRRVFYVNRV